MKSFILLVSFFSSVAFGADAPDMNAVGFIEKIYGAKHIKIFRTNKQLLEITENSPIFPGDNILTASKTAVDIRLSDGSAVRIGANSVYKIESASFNGKFWRWTSKLLVGVMRALVKSSGKGDVKFRVETPTGTIGVRGTEFISEYIPSEKRTALYTLEGVVWFGAKGVKFTKKEKFVTVGASRFSYVDSANSVPRKVYRIESGSFKSFNTPETHQYYNWPKVIDGSLELGEPMSFNEEKQRELFAEFLFRFRSFEEGEGEPSKAPTEKREDGVNLPEFAPSDGTSGPEVSRRTRGSSGFSKADLPLWKAPASPKVSARRKKGGVPAFSGRAHGGSGGLSSYDSIARRFGFNSAQEALDFISGKRAKRAETNAVSTTERANGSIPTLSGTNESSNPALEQIQTGSVFLSSDIKTGGEGFAPTTISKPSGLSLEDCAALEHPMAAQSPGSCSYELARKREMEALEAQAAAAKGATATSQPTQSSSTCDRRSCRISCACRYGGAGADLSCPNPGPPNQAAYSSCLSGCDTQCNVAVPGGAVDAR